MLPRNVRGSPRGDGCPLEGKALRLSPSSVRCAPCLPFSDMRPATNGTYPLGTPADLQGGKSVSEDGRGTLCDRTHPKKI